MFEILNTKNIVAVTATANVIKKASKCNVRWQSFGSPPDHCLTRFGGPTGFLVDSGHRSTLISSPADCWIILETVKCGECLCWRLIILLSQCHCQFGKVHEALCWWSTKRTFFCGTQSCGVVYPIDSGAIVNDFGHYLVPYVVQC